MFGIKLNQDGDIDLSSGSTVIVKDNEQLKDALKAYLLMNRNTWFEDKKRGFPITRQSSAEKISKNFLDSYYYSRLKNYRDIKSILDFRSSISPVTRVYTMTFKIISNFSKYPETLKLEL